MAGCGSTGQIPVIGNDTGRARNARLMPVDPPHRRQAAQHHRVLPSWPTEPGAGPLAGYSWQLRSSSLDGEGTPCGPRRWPSWYVRPDPPRVDRARRMALAPRLSPHPSESPPINVGCRPASRGCQLLWRTINAQPSRLSMQTSPSTARTRCTRPRPPRWWRFRQVCLCQRVGRGRQPRRGW